MGTPEFTEEEYVDEFDAAFRVGSKILDAADRVAEMHKIVPGSQAVWHFTADDIRFKVTIVVAEPADQDAAHQ
jgi:hypothetical protein